ncbi:MAG: chorismate mutase [Candidatus Woesearchaeota archaeon]
MNIEDLRNDIDNIDSKIIELLVKRKNIVKKVAATKKEKNLPILDEKREIELTKRLKEKAKIYGLDKDFVVALYEIILENSKKHQENEII